MCPIGEIRGVAKRRVFDASILPIVVASTKVVYESDLISGTGVS